jgi:KaiC/GvpD/RAD55 family RecA-like ATPase
MANPAIHSVQIYDDSATLIARLCGIVSSSLRVGDAVLIVATPEHRRDLVQQLKDAGIDVRSVAREGRFTMLDARELLAAFMVNGMPARHMFMESVGSMLSQVKSASRSSSQSLTVFGEMVAVLWDEGKKDAALALESLWNELLNDNSFHLHCAYPRSVFSDGDESAVCSMHSHLLLAS